MSDRFDDHGHNHIEWRLLACFDLTPIDPRTLIMLPTEGLPEPLRAAAERLQQSGLTPEERTAAAKEFLLLSEEWTA